MSARPRAVIVVTGSELVRGDRRDANGPFLATELVRLGAEPARILIVGDRENELEAAIREGLAADICVLSGGLGPTHDDRTVEFLAHGTGRELRVDEGIAREIEAVSRSFAERMGRPYADFEAGVRKQASLPEGAISLGMAGTAPAVLLEHDGRVAVALPGPPGELRRLWPGAVASEAFRRILGRAGPRERRLLRFYGPSESAVARALAEGGGETEGVEVTVCARDFEINVDVFVERGAEEAADGLVSVLLERFGHQLFAEDERSVEEIVLLLCRVRGWTLATAESCTGGIIGARLTAVPGASAVFQGGIVSYSDAAKREQLGVPGALLERYGAVSAETAAAMAGGAREALHADVGVAATGIAGPGDGTPEKPVGLVYLHAEGPEGGESRSFQLPGDREVVRQRAAASALHLLRRLLSRSGHTSA